MKAAISGETLGSVMELNKIIYLIFDYPHKH